MCWTWIWARIFPAFNHRAELRDALAIDVRVNSKIDRPSGRDDFGWAAGMQSIPVDKLEFLTKKDLKFYHPALTQPALSPGAVQALPNGQCVVLGVDGQTIGGYPKIAQVISADLDKVGQLRPGDRVKFERVDLVEAEIVYRLKARETCEWVTRLQVSLRG